ncbi:exonuclease SbcCD subunit D C-terminal domain-containing protein [Aquimarina rhabdastrellae]
MKLLHTADWHLGHRLHEQSQHEEQALFLEWLIHTIKQEEIDIVLLSGDVYDTGVPATQSQKLYYDFLIKLRETSCKHVVITGGNHDAPGTINAPKALLEALAIHVVGKATEDVKDEVFELEVNGEQVIIAAVPYLRDQDIRRAVAGESFDEINDRYKAALVNHYTAVAQHCESIRTDETPVIAMGHLFAVGGSTSDSELNIYVGNLGHIGADDFPELFDYVALGHLHRPQKVGGKDYIRYSGSPNVLSFSEINYDKKVITITLTDKKVTAIDEITVPNFRKVIRIKGTVEQCIFKLQQLEYVEETLTPWVEVILEDETVINTGYHQIHQIAETAKVKILKITIKNDRSIKGLEQLVKTSQSIKELEPLEVFKKRCEEAAIDLEKDRELLDAFQEALQIARKQ